MPVITARSRSTSRSPRERRRARGASPPPASPPRGQGHRRHPVELQIRSGAMQQATGVAALVVESLALLFSPSRHRRPNPRTVLQRRAVRCGAPQRGLASRPQAAPAACRPARWTARPAPAGVTLFLNECSRAVMGWAISLQPSSAGFSRPCATRCPRSPTAGPSARPAPAALGIRAGVRGRGRAGRGRPPVVRHARALVGALGGGRFRSARGWCRRGRSGRSRSACAERGSLPG